MSDPLALLARADKWLLSAAGSMRLDSGSRRRSITVQPGGVFASEWLVQGLRHAPLHLIAWTDREAADVDRHLRELRLRVRLPHHHL